SFYEQLLKKKRPRDTSCVTTASRVSRCLPCTHSYFFPTLMKLCSRRGVGSMKSKVKSHGKALRK
ncbi:hypothetical protein JG688_00017724, partial [Phytophthora aleatoria]